MGSNSRDDSFSLWQTQLHKETIKDNNEECVTNAHTQRLPNVQNYGSNPFLHTSESPAQQESHFYVSSFHTPSPISPLTTTMSTINPSMRLVKMITPDINETLHTNHETPTPSQHNYGYAPHNYASTPFSSLRIGVESNPNANYAMYMSERVRRSMPEDIQRTYPNKFEGEPESSYAFARSPSDFDGFPIRNSINNNHLSSMNNSFNNHITRELPQKNKNFNQNNENNNNNNSIGGEYLDPFLYSPSNPSLAAESRTTSTTSHSSSFALSQEQKDKNLKEEGWVSTRPKIEGTFIPNVARPSPKRQRIKNEAPESIAGSVTSTAGEPFFYLEEQPNQVQRKCYSGENRYLLPNPLVISSIHKDKKISKATVTVSLASVDGIPLNGEDCIICSSGLKRKLKRSLTAEYVLKLHNPSGRSTFRLLFVVQYNLNGTIQRDTILSSSFTIQTNKVISPKEPKLLGLMPRCGLATEETELWIRGSDFSRRGVIVTFDGVNADVTEVLPNLLTVRAPKKTDLETATEMVEVCVSNKLKYRVVSSATTLIFVYYKQNKISWRV